MIHLGEVDCGVPMNCQEVCDPFCVALIGVSPAYTMENCCSDQCTVSGQESAGVFDEALISRPGGCNILLTELEAYAERPPRAEWGGIPTDAETRLANQLVAEGKLWSDAYGIYDLQGWRVDPTHNFERVPGQTEPHIRPSASPAGGGTLAEALAMLQSTGHCDTNRFGATTCNAAWEQYRTGQIASAPPPPLAPSPAALAPSLPAGSTAAAIAAGAAAGGGGGAQAEEEAGGLSKLALPLAIAAGLFMLLKKG